ncbi:MAG: glutathione peroxidase [Gammaproteobacteria bacterium]|jgi:glutathione peroxidase
MKHKSLILLIILVPALILPAAATASEAPCPQTLNFTKRTLAGHQEVNLCKAYLGKVVVVVNTASKCGYTYQYEGLEALYRKYKDKGLVVLGFPSNDFGGQEPGTEKQIQDFCRLTYGVEFPMFEKTHASRYNADPLYKTMAKLSGEYPQWNFHKYVLDRNGKLVASFSSRVEPQGSELIAAIEDLL